MKGDLHLLSAVDAAGAVCAGRLSSEALVAACLERIAATDDTIKAWVYLNPEEAVAQARELDQIRKSGHATGPLHGVPVALKDIIDTKDVPCERGSAIFAGRRPGADAALVERLREAGAVIMGKTKTTEMAFVHPTDTTNPHDSTRTPGGSSSGSAAAVAAGHVPLAIGSQTAGSVIRPASYCGVYGFKPTRGVISRRGVLETSTTLDQMGVFARTLEDAALLTDAIASYDPADSASFARPRPKMLEGVRSEAPVEPDFAWFEFPFLDRLEADAREGFEELLEALGPRVERFPVSDTFADLANVQVTIHEYEFCHHLEDIIAAHWDQLSESLQPVVERGRAISEDQYEEALEVRASAVPFFEKHFKDFDAILSPSATGEAPPITSGNTGDPIFCRIPSLAGLPALTLPLLVGENSLPIGVQLIGSAEKDDRLLRTARWMQHALQDEADEEA